MRSLNLNNPSKTVKLDKWAFFGKFMTNSLGKKT